MKIFQFMAFRIKLLTGQKVLLFRFHKIGGFIMVLMVKLNIKYDLIMDCLIKFVIRLNILYVKKWYYR